MQTSPKMRTLIEGWEGLRLAAYQDMVGVWTIGYGHTGKDVHPGMVITQAQADQLLEHDLARFEMGVTGLTTKRPPTQEQFDALVSFSYNLGLGALASSTLLRLHLIGDFAGAKAQFTRWDHAGGVEVPALFNRRAKEANVYLYGAY